MQKEKVNTHFSFPMKLDMSSFVEQTLMPQQYNDSKKNQHDKNSTTSENVDVVMNDNMDPKSNESLQNDMNISNDEFGSDDDEFAEHYEYRLIGVTVHTGTADGGHYYSFIKERSNPNNAQQQDRWFLFNDAEVKQFDPSQIEAECFGGEMTSKTYDSVTEKYLDFSFEKTNSAYMLFYERCVENKEDDQQNNQSVESKSYLDDYEQMPSCSSAPPENSVPIMNSNSPIKQQPSVVVQETSPDLDENKNSTALAASEVVPSKHLSQNSEQQETETVNSDLAIGQNKCDIDNKIDAKSNASDIIAANDDKTKKVTTFRSTTPENVLSRELEEWIWEDNRFFLQDRNIFEHTYFK